MEATESAETIKSYIFACTSNTEKECLDRMLISTNLLYADKALSVKKGDLIFLLNLDTDILYGIFKAKSDGGKNIIPEAHRGKYPYQIMIDMFSNELKETKDAKKNLSLLGIDWRGTITEKRLELLLKYFANPDGFEWEEAANEIELLDKKEKANSDEKPKLEATTLWDYPKQSYGLKPKGNNKYAGVTPAFIIYNMVKRYTELGDLVVDPMAGSGTTFDVCQEEGRKCIAYDIVSTRPEILQNDARKIPLQDNSVDMVFIDSPYGDNIKYNDHIANFGEISAEDERFYDELEKAMKESHRILKPGKVLGWLIGDQWVKKKFTPVGFKVYEKLCKYFETVDVVCVTRRNQSSNTGIWYNRAIRFNFYLRGFKYLFIMRKKISGDKEDGAARKVSWTRYER